MHCVGSFKVSLHAGFSCLECSGRQFSSTFVDHYAQRCQVLILVNVVFALLSALAPHLQTMFCSQDRTRTRLLHWVAERRSLNGYESSLNGYESSLN
eukprot:1789029-Pleurochrysis_carterae.AAC.1